LTLPEKAAVDKRRIGKYVDARFDSPVCFYFLSAQKTGTKASQPTFTDYKASALQKKSHKICDSFSFFVQ